MATLATGAIYIGDDGRFVCAEIHCAGATAFYSGHDLSGQKLARLRVQDVAELGKMLRGRPVLCECGKVRLLPLAGKDGWPLAVVAPEGCAHESVVTPDGNGSFCRFCGETVA